MLQLHLLRNVNWTFLYGNYSQQMFITIISACLQFVMQRLFFSILYVQIKEKFSLLIALRGYRLCYGLG